MTILIRSARLFSDYFSKTRRQWPPLQTVVAYAHVSWLVSCHLSESTFLNNSWCDWECTSPNSICLTCWLLYSKRWDLVQIICTLLQTEITTPARHHSYVWQAGCYFWRPNNSVKARKANNRWIKTCLVHWWLITLTPSMSVVEYFVGCGELWLLGSTRVLCHCGVVRSHTQWWSLLASSGLWRHCTSTLYQSRGLSAPSLNNLWLHLLLDTSVCFQIKSTSLCFFSISTS